MMITLLNYDDDDVSTRVADQIFITLKLYLDEMITEKLFFLETTEKNDNI